MKRLLPTLLLCGLFMAAHAQRVVLNDPNQTYPIFDHCTVLEVKPGQNITVDSLLKFPDKYRFSPIKQKPVQPDGKRYYWFKIELTNPSPDNYFLRFFSVGDMLVQGYEVDTNQVMGNWQVDYYGASTPNLFQRGRSIIPLQLRQGQTHTLYLYVPRMGIPDLHIGVMSAQKLAEDTHYQDLFYGLFYGFILIIATYSLLLGIRLKDRDNILYTIQVIMAGIVVSYTYGILLELPGSWAVTLKHNYGALIGISNCSYILFCISFLQLKQRALWLYRLAIGLLVLFGFAALIAVGIYLIGPNDSKFQFYLSTFGSFIGILFRVLAGIVILFKRYTPGFFYALGYFSVLLLSTLFSLSHYGVLPLTFWMLNSLLIGTITEISFYLLGLTYKINQLKKNQDKAIRDQLRLTQENQTLIENQNRVLEEKVEQRTAELRASQAQLIQKEKLASLGELTAGIAHEIQNPLNFVNNFSEVSTELVEEQKEALTKGDLEEVSLIADDLSQNLQKITHHGRRAEAIVRGMLEHSRPSTGEKQPTNLNALADEYLRLAYQGQRAKDKAFNCQLITDFDSHLPPVSVVAQDIGRVLLNLYNNAFYAIGQRARQTETDYEPTVWVSSRQASGRVVIGVKDNGTGIPEAIRQKIFQPFFTTKPTGEGTGLGLSLSYDITIKGHGGTMAVESQEGQGCEFIIRLPA